MPPLLSALTPTRSALSLVAVALLAGCASRGPDRDGPETNPPQGLAQVPDAEPRVEPLRRGGPNKPYEVLGERYVPVADDLAMHESGLASWYGRKFHGRPTASGEPYDMYAMTAAHKTMPIPSYARVRNPANGREVVVRINDRGPFVAGRVIDLSYTAALKLGLLGGVAPVALERLTHDDIRAGLGRRAPVPSLAEPPPAAEDALMALLAAKVATGPAPGVPPDATAEAATDRPAAASAMPATAMVSATGPMATGFWLQLGAFGQRDGAARLQQRVQREAETLAPLITVLEGLAGFRVQAGPFGSRAEALSAADQLRRLLQLKPLLVERR